ncbi:hypothetical protein [Alkalicoccus chagannorensis]|uniref:hypothetical protein n=1 Tax=Alkalicoccus chagannorensis TaxID=427072 RepID=UPI00041CF40D|nr:hypothetical protein [Alkalicoccus chagannorensis]
MTEQNKWEQINEVMEDVMRMKSALEPLLGINAIHQEEIQKLSEQPEASAHMIREGLLQPRLNGTAKSMDVWITEIARDVELLNERLEEMEQEIKEEE